MTALQLLAACAATSSPPPSADAKIALVDYGIYYAAIRAQSGAAATAAGYYNRIDSVPPSEQTDNVCAKLGAAIGVRYSLVETGPREVGLQVDYDNPPITAPSGHTTTHESLATTLRAGERHISTYGFDHTYELVPGDWTISVRSGSNVLLRRTFHVRTDCPVDKLSF